MRPLRKQRSRHQQLQERMKGTHETITVIYYHILRTSHIVWCSLLHAASRELKLNTPLPTSSPGFVVLMVLTVWCLRAVCWGSSGRRKWGVCCILPAALTPPAGPIILCVGEGSATYRSLSLSFLCWTFRRLCSICHHQGTTKKAADLRNMPFLMTDGRVRPSVCREHKKRTYAKAWEYLNSSSPGLLRWQVFKSNSG